MQRRLAPESIISALHPPHLLTASPAPLFPERETQMSIAAQAAASGFFPPPRPQINWDKRIKGAGAAGGTTERNVYCRRPDSEARCLSFSPSFSRPLLFLPSSLLFSSFLSSSVSSHPATTCLHPRACRGSDITACIRHKPATLLALMLDGCPGLFPLLLLKALSI